MDKFKYSAGLPGYGTKGDDGSVGLTGLSMFISDMDGVTDQPTITTRINANKTLMISSSDNIPGYPERVYQTGDLFVDKNLAIYEIDKTLVNKYLTTGLSLESGSAILQERAMSPNGNFDRYTNNITDKPFKIIDIAYGLGLSDFYTSAGEVYNVSAGDYAQVFCSNYDVMANNKSTYTLYTSNSDVNNQFAIIRETSSNTFRIGNKDKNGIIRDVSLGFDFKNINFNSNTLKINSSTSNFTFDVNFNRNSVFNYQPYIATDVSLRGNINLLKDTFIQTIDSSLSAGSSTLWLKSGVGNASSLTTGAVLLTTGLNNTTMPFTGTTFSTGDINLFTGYITTSISDTYVSGSPVDAMATGNINLQTGVFTDYVLGNPESGLKSAGTTGDINITTGAPNNTDIYGGFASNVYAGNSGKIELKTSNGGNCVINFLGAVTGLNGGDSGLIEIHTGNGGTGSGLGLAINGGAARDIFIYGGTGGAGVNGGTTGKNGHVLLQYNSGNLQKHNVGIGRIPANNDYRLVIQDNTAGNYEYYDAAAGVWGHTSDRRLKTDISNIPNALEKINEINGVFYHCVSTNEEKYHVGVIAQDIEKVLPEIISTDEEGYLGVSYTGLVPLLINAIKEQQIIINDLKSRIEILEA